MEFLLLLASVVFGDDGFFVVKPVVLPTPTPAPAPVIDGGFVVKPVVMKQTQATKPKEPAKAAPKPVVKAKASREVKGTPIGGVYPPNRYNTMYHLTNPREAHASRIPRNADLNSLSDSQLVRLHDLLHAGQQVKWFQQQRCNGQTCSMYSYPILN